jgi:osmotically-inducible protein OsmY
MNWGNRRENMYGNRSERERRNMQNRDWWDRTRDEVSSWFGDEDAERRRDMDRSYQGGHRGKGPRNYHRSEDRIKEDICDRLTEDDMLDATDIDVEVHADEVVLTGTVNNRMQKHRAEDLVESVSGVHNVENRLRVTQYGMSETSSGTSNMTTGTREINVH